MHDHEMNVQQMLWQPKLLKLTACGFPGLGQGLPTTIYLTPQNILSVRRALTRQHMTGTDPVEYFPPLEATVIIMITGHQYDVVETPEQIALLRDKALGYEPVPLKAV